MNASKRACLSCRKRKEKCTGTEPCASCVRRKEACLYIAHHRGGPRYKGISKVHVDGKKTDGSAGRSLFVTSLVEGFPSLPVASVQGPHVSMVEDIMLRQIDNVRAALVETLWIFATGDKSNALKTLKETCDAALASKLFETTTGCNRQVLVELWINDKVLHAFSGSTTCFLPFALQSPIDADYAILVGVADVLRQASLSNHAIDKTQQFDDILAGLRLRLPQSMTPLMARTRVMLDTACIMIHSRRAQIVLPFLIQAPACGLILDPTMNRSDQSMSSVERCLSAANDMVAVSANSQVAPFQLSCSLALASVVHANALIMGWQLGDAREKLESSLRQLRELALTYNIACLVLERLDTVLSLVKPESEPTRPP